jgi:hypothetical protein
MVCFEVLKIIYNMSGPELEHILGPLSVDLRNMRRVDLFGFLCRLDEAQVETLFYAAAKKLTSG